MSTQMNNKSKNQTKMFCPFGICQLPPNKNNFKAQFLYLFFAYFFLLKDKSQFTGMNIVLFTIPIVIDLFCSSKYTGFPRIAKYFLTFCVVFCLIISLLSVFDFFQTTNDAFIAGKDVILFSGLEISKTAISIVLLPSIFTPYILSIGASTQQDVYVINMSSNDNYKKR